MKHLSDNNFNTNKLQNVPNPASSGDAVNKAYADTKVQGVNTSRITVSSTEPTSPTEGDIWIDPEGDDTLGDLAFKNEAELNIPSDAVLDSRENALLAALYPVGSVYIGGSSTIPAILSEIGTWSQIQGRFIVGVSASGGDFPYNSTGGTKTETLTLAQIPAHSHNVGRSLNAGSGTSRYTPTESGTANDTPTSSAGETQPHNNLPPYKAKYIWERTA